MKKQRRAPRTASTALVVGVVILVSLLAAGCRSEEEIIIGAPMPLTGFYASDGEQMQMALELAVKEKNAEGGLLGRQLRLLPGDVGECEAEKIQAVAERLVGAGADVILTGYADSGVATPAFGVHDMPYLHADAFSLSTIPVAENPEFRNAFMYCPNEHAYGEDAADKLFDVGEEMGWTPPNNRIAIISVDWMYNYNACETFRELAEQQGYETALKETVQFGVAEWGPILSKIESAEPAYIVYCNVDASDAARFMIQFREYFADTGLDALIWMQYTPTIPEFLELASDVADGLIWATSIGVIRDVSDYEARWTAEFGSGPKATYSYATRDAFDIWVAAVEKAGCVECYDDVIQNIRESEHEGMCGIYRFNEPDQTADSGDDTLPIIWYQIWDGEHHVTSPTFLKKIDYRMPPWIPTD